MSWLSTARLPRPHDPERRDVAWTRWSEKAARPDDPTAVALLDALFGNSPYLTETALQNPTFMTDLWRGGPDSIGSDLAIELDAVRAAARAGAPPAAVATRLRQLKRRLALNVAVADIAGVWPLDKVTGALSAFAAGCLDALTDSILLQLARDGQLAIGSDPDAAALTVLGMGKLGAGELNYSSDIDLILLYDRDAPALADNEQLARHFVRGARMLVQLMSETSADGYIFRTDLRLRPDPGSTPLAMSVQAAELYYESVGQNWERAAMIKAHPVAGNRAVGEAFLADLAPYIWRKHLDFAAIHDIHSIKRQIDAYRGGGAVKVLGHNVKLGRGGIREIEFFAQTQQLIFGGRNPSLRLRGTCEALRALAAAGHVAPARGGRADRGLRLPAPGRAPPADGRRPPDPQPARRRGGRRRDRHLPGLCRVRRLPEGAARPPALRRKPLRAAVRGGAEPGRPRRQPGLHRHRRRSRHARDPARRWASAIPRRRPASCGAGITAATAPRRRRARASC